MFTLKLGTGVGFDVTSVSENYYNTSGDVTVDLNIEVIGSDRPLEYYLDLLTADGALDHIQVYLDNTVVFESKNHNKIVSANRRLIPTGEWHLIVILNGRTDEQKD